MKQTIMRDAEARPDLFHWRGGVPPEVVVSLLSRTRWAVPVDLQELWRETGGGDVFESEVILAPGEDLASDDDIERVNVWLRDKGLPSGLMVFHTGLGVSAVRLLDGVYVRLDPETYRVLEELDSLDAWYRSGIRSEYAARYGLQA